MYLFSGHCYFKTPTDALHSRLVQCYTHGGFVLALDIGICLYVYFLYECVLR